ncbi:substrate-binding domain-containing protein [Dapis sp. BLCC M126]|uniref:substrate-binding domain-containing protein n=1 Tax=Dapis sp. BLCC M126 TaxID=3400189 RepID=UPI003CFB00D0
MTTINHKCLKNRRIFYGIIACAALALAYALIPGLNQKINDADVATVYESIALYRWQQSGSSQNKPYQVYYLNPTVETVARVVIVRQNVNGATANAAGKFVDFLTQPEQQKLFVQYGFRPTHGNIDLLSVANSPWNQNIPGAQVNPQVDTLPALQPSVLGEIQRLWQRVQ